MLGLARSGEAAAAALARRGVRVVGVDRNESLDAGRLRQAGVEVVLGAEDPALLDDVDLVVKSPGVPSEAPLAAAARARGLTIWSEVELGSRLLANPLVGVTGTNGKTTTSELLGAVFRAADRSVAVAGNVGRPLTALDGAIPDDAWIVCELSSFQLEDIESFRPRDRRPPEPDAGPPRPPRRPRRLPRREAPHLREPGPRRRRCRPARLRRAAGIGPARRVRRRRPAARRAAHPRRPQPGERRRSDRGCTRCRHR